MRRLHRAVAAGVLAAAAVVLLLLALDVRRIEATFRTDDAAFGGSASQTLWRPPQVLPFSVGQRLLGTRDDVAYRRAVQYFRLGRPRASATLDPRLEALRGRAQGALARLEQSGLDARRRSAVANLIGVLSFADSAADPSTRDTYLAQGAAAFARAVTLDPADDDAKYNLELALSRLRSDPGNGSSAGGRRRGQLGGGAGGGGVGSGY